MLNEVLVGESPYSDQTNEFAILWAVGSSQLLPKLVQDADPRLKEFCVAFALPSSSFLSSLSSMPLIPPNNKKMMMQHVQYDPTVLETPQGTPVVCGHREDTSRVPGGGDRESGSDGGSPLDIKESF